MFCRDLTHLYCNWSCRSFFGIRENDFILKTFSRSVWSLSVLFLTINRYRIINGKPGYSIFTANILIGLTWTQSILICTFWTLLSPSGPWYDLHKHSKVAGIILENVLTLVVTIPVPIVLILLLMTSYRARQHLARFAEEGETRAKFAEEEETRAKFAEEEETRPLLTSPQMEGDLKLLYAFGVVYVVGFGLMFVVNVNQLLNLGGVVNVVPYWQSSPTFCVYMTCCEQVSNMVINFANSVIIVQSRQVRGVLRRVARRFTR